MGLFVHKPKQNIELKPFRPSLPVARLGHLRFTAPPSPAHQKSLFRPLSPATTAATNSYILPPNSDSPTLTAWSNFIGTWRYRHVFLAKILTFIMFYSTVCVNCNFVPVNYLVYVYYCYPYNLGTLVYSMYFYQYRYK